MSDRNLDVLIIGAGISGIGTACHLATECPAKTFAILDRRENVGGTWDLFRYPGIRSDSDVFTFGYKFRPWTGTQTLADGDSIKEYVSNTAREYGVYDHIHFGRKVSQANWSSQDKCWQVTALNKETGQLESYRAQHLVMATGYYNHDRGYTPEFPGLEKFGGQVIHPQHWPEDLDYQGKKIVVIGSGATAVTLVPAMAQQGAGHITMLQRSPSYIFSVPPEDKIFKLLSKYLPRDTAYAITRWRNVKFYRLMWNSSKRWPGLVRKLLLRGVRNQVGEEQMQHFTPDYKPWDERMCAVPGNDLFKCINEGTASVVTDHIAGFSEKGLRLESGQELEADIIITATGLELQAMGGASVMIDGEEQAINERRMYKAVMVEGLPNFSQIMGYVNYPWTLKADLASQYICRVIKHMDKKGYRVARPVADDNRVLDKSIMFPLESGYVRRGGHRLPRQGEGKAWKVAHDYLGDKKLLLDGPIDDGILRFDTGTDGGRQAPDLQTANAA